MFASNTRQLKHGDLSLTKNRFEFGVGIDGAFVSGVLQAVGFDVVPDFFNDFGTGYGLITNHGG